MLISDFATCAIQILPAFALLDHRLQILQPDDAVLYRVFYDGSDQTGREVMRAQYTVTEMAGQGQPVIDDRDRFGSAHRSAGGFDLRLPIARFPITELPEDRDNAAYLFQGRRFCG